MSGPNDLLPVKNCFDIFRLFRVEAPAGDQIDRVTDAHPDWGRSGLRDRRRKQAAFATPDGFGIRKPPPTYPGRRTPSQAWASGNRKNSLRVDNSKYHRCACLSRSVLRACGCELR